MLTFRDPDNIQLEFFCGRRRRLIADRQRGRRRSCQGTHIVQVNSRDAPSSAARRERSK
jgi:hypothetical protein